VKRDKGRANCFAAIALILIPVFVAGCGRFTNSSSSSGGGGGGSPLLAVADATNNRVLIYNSSLTAGESASVVLGQGGFTTMGFGTTATTMDNPAGVAVDASGNIYVVDQLNCRVLQFAKPFTTGMAATVALGQPNLTTGSCLNGAASNTTLGQSLGGVAIDAGGNVWVADSYYSRIVKYPATISAGEAASAAIGQTSFTSTGASTGCNQNSATPSASTLCFPGGLAFDATGNLWVVDNGNNRILMYTKASLPASGAAAIAAAVELGQPGFLSGTANNGGTVTASTLSLPLSGIGGIAFDSSGNLWIADTNNHRVLAYAKASLLNSGAAAMVELGQPAGTTAFTSNGMNNPTIGASTLNHPVGLAFDGSGNLMVGDSGNNRVLMFSPTFTNGISAGVVLGQGSFTSSTGGLTTQTSLWGPAGVAALQ